MQLESLVIPIGFDTGLLLKGIDLIQGAITGAVDATFEWAKDLDKLGDVTGMSSDKVAAWAFIAKKAGVPVDALASSMVIMEKGLVKTNGALDVGGEKLQAMGINVKDANGKIRDQSDLMNDIAKKYGTFATQQDKVNFLTEIFGRSGAQLVDVFDTLSKEGGIDAVTQKVKDMGLAIDPSRYEQFQRNLEELKMAGLGLQVAFTEAVMPALEGLLTWVDTLRGKNLGEVLDIIGKGAMDLSKNFKDWAASVDWAALSQKLIDGINNIDWAAIGVKFGEFWSNIFAGVSTIAENTDWSGLTRAAGKAFLNFMAGLTGQGSWTNVKTTWHQNLLSLEDIVVTSCTIMHNKLIEFLDGIGVSIGTYFASVYNKAKQLMDNFKNGIVAGLQGALKAVQDWMAKIAAALSITLPTIPVSGGAGGTVGAKASGGFAGGLTLVGENGPELVNLPGGAYVNNNQASNRMMNQPVQAYIDYDELARTMARVLGQQMQRA